MNIHTAIQKGKLFLKEKKIKTSDLDSQILMSKAINKEKKFIILNFNKKLSKKNLEYFYNLIDQRANGKPSAQSTRPSPNPQLQKQVAPGRSRSGSAPNSGEPATYTPADITQFFTDVRKGKYKGREDERGRIERDIFAAQAEGRIVNA